MAHGRPPGLDDWFRQWPPDQREQAQALAEQVHAAAADVDEAIKWRRLTFTVDGNWHHWLCAVSVTSRGVSLMFHKGALLDDPAGLLQGDGRYLRQVPYDDAVAALQAVRALVRQAVVHQTDMLE